MKGWGMTSHSRAAGSWQQVKGEMSGVDEAADEARRCDSSIGHQLGRVGNEPVQAG